MAMPPAVPARRQDDHQQPLMIARFFRKSMTAPKSASARSGFSMSTVTRTMLRHDYTFGLRCCDSSTIAGCELKSASEDLYVTDH